MLESNHHNLYTSILDSSNITLLLSQYTVDTVGVNSNDTLMDSLACYEILRFRTLKSIFQEMFQYLQS